MKKIILHVFFVFSMIFSMGAMAQDIYWREGFEGGAISTSNPLTGGGPNNYYATSVNSGDGTWYLHNTYRTTGTPCPTYGSQHLRLLQNGTDTPYFVLPVVDFGVNEVHFARSANSTTPGARTRRVSIFVRADTSASISPYTGAGWVRVGVGPASDNFCVDTAFIIPAPFNTTARRIAIGSSQAANTDLDSIWLVSAMPITTPVRFNGIRANVNNGVVKVLWSIESEVNTIRYDIERSAEGRNFTLVGSVSATNVRNYNWFDYAPVAGNNYYRVKGIDRDAKVTVSSVIKIVVGQTSLQLVVSPNPVQNNILNLQVSNVEPGNYKLSLFNSAGQVVFSTIIRNEGRAISESTRLPSQVIPGVYTLQLTNGLFKEKSLISVR